MKTVNGKKAPSSANIYLFKVNNRNTRKRCEQCSTLTIKHKNNVFVKSAQSFFSIWFFFYEHSRFPGQQRKGEAISSTPLYHFHRFHRQLDISQAIAAESSPLLRVNNKDARTTSMTSLTSFLCFCC